MPVGRRWLLLFSDRVDAGRRLAEHLAHLRGEPVVVLGLPRGGVPVAAQVAEALHAPLDVIMVRKLGLPFQPELAMGAIGEDGVRVINSEVIRSANLSVREFAEVEERERAELERRAARFRAGRQAAPLAGKVAVIVDDGIATGSTARAACEVARAHGAARVVLAVPVAPPGWTSRFATEADELVGVATPAPFHAVGEWYADFSQTTDEEVIALLSAAAARDAHEVPANDPDPSGGALERDEEVTVEAGPVELPGHLTIPAGAPGVVVFAHGSGSSRHSPRNKHIAEVLSSAGLGTLLFDLLSPSEEAQRANVFDISLLGHRLRLATSWLRDQSELRLSRVGYFGASTGAAAALWAAAEPDADVAAVVSRGGRPDLAGPRLAAVRAPTLLIVGGHDQQVLELNRRAEQGLRCKHSLVVVPGASHLFEEPGTLDEAAALARDWFVEHLVKRASAR